ncbi:MAG: hypothetical protein NWE92_03470 [Candidatus Bathyarchaeota archaeon]|nr:hypothetical protein [Candidatus Bathyarchaeota archaeon]
MENDDDAKILHPIAQLQKEIIKMQNESASRARLTQSVILSMTLASFLIGGGLIILAIVEFFHVGNTSLGIISTAGGLSSITAVLLYRPMQKAQNSVNSLVQLQIAYLSFNSKVTIWTEYVNARSNDGSGIDIERVKEATADIESAASKALIQIDDFCSERGKKSPN